MKFAVLALIGAASATQISHNQERLYELMNLQTEGPTFGFVNSKEVDAGGCPVPLEITEDELQYQLGEFSRNFSMDKWDNAMKVKSALAKAGKAPKFAVTTKELYDKSFSFPKVRNYDYAVEQMNELEHYEDNLNNNLSNKLALTRFVEVAKKTRANLNDKYDIGFIDPGVEGDW
tara:strand:- start:423 stop:947 length:525 start_codon:yes stop_codon:yes gene_type:complete